MDPSQSAVGFRRIRNFGFGTYVVLCFGVVAFCMAMLLLHFFYNRTDDSLAFYTSTISYIIGQWTGLILTKLLARSHHAAQEGQANV